MNEIVKFECACDLGYDKGAIKKTIENNIFTIFGNLNQKNSIVIRYHGLLTEKNDVNSTTFNMFYYFDNLENDKKIVKLEKCAKCSNGCYCTTIDLDMHNSFHFGFVDNNNNHELDNTFRLEILPDPISSLMQKYGFETNTNLPTKTNDSPRLFDFENLIVLIKNFFKNIFIKQKG